MTLSRLLLLPVVAIILCACPYESAVPLAARPAEAIDSSLIGYWYGIVKDGSDYFGIEALEIDKETDSTYTITRYGKAVKGDIILPDTSYFTGYISHLGDQRFMNIEGSVVITTLRGKKPPEITVQKVFYLSNLGRSNDTLTVKTITEKFTPTRKTITDPGMLEREVRQMLGQGRNIYDDLYSLSYRKIQKPKPLKAF